MRAVLQFPLNCRRLCVCEARGIWDGNSLQAKGADEMKKLYAIGIIIITLALVPLCASAGQLLSLTNFNNGTIKRR